MKRILMSLVAVLAAAILPSCYQQEATITLEKDGSGTILEQVFFTPQALDAMGGESSKGEVDKLLSREKAAERAKSLGEGVTIDKVEPFEKDGGRGAHMIYHFTDINKLKYTPPGEDIKKEIVGKMSGDNGPKEPAKPTTFAYASGVLTITNPYEIKAQEAAAEPVVENASQNAATEAARSLMGNMSASLKLVASPGIAQTTATHVKDNAITLTEIHMADVFNTPGAYAKLQAAGKDKNKGMAILRDCKGTKIEDKPIITVTLK